jgi:hypothetical protein
MSFKDLGKDNVTLLTEFVFTRLTDREELQVPLFLLLFVIYFMTIMGNIGLIALIWNDPHLHIPMYFFLGNLAFVDACLSSTVTPKMLVNFFNGNKMISLSECMVQFFFCCNLGNHRMFSFGSNGLSSRCRHMRSFILSSDNDTFQIITQRHARHSESSGKCKLKPQ